MLEINYKINVLEPSNAVFLMSVELVVFREGIKFDEIMHYTFLAVFEFVYLD